MICNVLDFISASVGYYTQYKKKQTGQHIYGAMNEPLLAWYPSSTCMFKCHIRTSSIFQTAPKKAW